MRSDLTAEEIELTRTTVEQLAPDELPLLSQLMTKPSWRDRFQGSSVGYGIESDIAVISSVAIPVCMWVLAVARDESRKIFEERIRKQTRRLLQATPEVAPPEVVRPVNLEQLQSAAAEYSVALGLEPGVASLLAAAIVGSVVLPDKSTS
jgi:hypothetical protein